MQNTDLTNPGSRNIPMPNYFTPRIDGMVWSEGFRAMQMLMLALTGRAVKRQPPKPNPFVGLP
jgi:hypothetical protein